MDATHNNPHKNGNMTIPRRLSTTGTAMSRWTMTDGNETRQKTWKGITLRSRI
jgi:hypothetical protein